MKNFDKNKGKIKYYEINKYLYCEKNIVDERTRAKKLV